MSLSLILFLLAIHWLADFALQSDEMALNKSTSNRWLTIHVAVYMLVFLLTTGHVLFVVLNGVLHWGTDWATSRWSARLWKAGQRHDFFAVIGFDQLIHLTTLFVTARYLLA